MAADVLQVLYIMYIYIWNEQGGSLRLPRKQYVVHQLFLHSFVYINHHERHQWVSEREGCAHTLQVLIKLIGCNNCFLHGHVMQCRSLFCHVMQLCLLGIQSKPPMMVQPTQAFSFKSLPYNNLGTVVIARFLMLVSSLEFWSVVHFVVRFVRN